MTKNAHQRRISIIYVEFLNQASTWFLEIAFVREVGVCLCLPPGYLREIKSEWPIKQVLLPFSFSVWHLLSILLMGGALIMKRVVSYFQRRAICCSFHNKRCLISCTLLTRQRASVLKVGVPYGL